MSVEPPVRPPSKGVAVTNWMMSKATGLLERRASRRGFLMGSAMAGSALAVAGIEFATRPETAYAAITGCAPGALCTDGYTEFCCAINNGVNNCPPGSFAGGWWRADFSSFCNGTRYYIDCMQNCCGLGIGGGFCASCTECQCAAGCNTRRVYCNYFRYGQCHTEIANSGPIACRVVTCVPPYTVAEYACSTTPAVDNSTAEHAGNCAPTFALPPLSLAVLPGFGAAAVPTPGNGTIFVRTENGGVSYRSWSDTTWGPWNSFGPTVNSGLSAVTDSTGVYLFGRGVDKALWYERLSGGVWSGWQSLGGVVTSDPSAVVDPAAGFHVFVRGSDFGVWYFRLSSSGGSGWKSLGPTALSDPVAVSDPSGLYVFITGLDGGIWYRRYTSGWSPWISLSPTATSDPVPVSDPTAGLHVFMRGRDNAVWYRRLVGASWTAWSSLGGTATSDPAAVSDPSGLYVFVRGTDNGVWYRRFAGGSWSGPGWTKLGPSIVSDPMAVSDTTGLYVFGQGVDNAIWYQQLVPGAPHWSGWQSLGGSMAPVRAII